MDVGFTEIKEIGREETMREKETETQREGDRKLPPQREWQKGREKGVDRACLLRELCTRVQIRTLSWPGCSLGTSYKMTEQASVMPGS